MMKFIPFFLAFALMGCASAPSFTGLSGSSVVENINTYNAYSNQDVKVPVLIYKPLKLIQNKPAVLFLSGCDGRHWMIHQELARRLNKSGVVVAEVKSIDAYGNQCSHPITLSGYRRTAHAIAAKNLLVSAGLANPDNVGVVGLSNGGWTVVSLLSNDIPNEGPNGDSNQGKGSEFSVGIGLYPYCDVSRDKAESLRTPTLLLGGGQDTWTHFNICVALFENNRYVDLIRYTEATHAWDAPLSYRSITFAGRQVYMGYDFTATKDSIERSWSFLKEHLEID